METSTNLSLLENGNNLTVLESPRIPIIEEPVISTTITECPNHDEFRGLMVLTILMFLFSRCYAIYIAKTYNLLKSNHKKIVYFYEEGRNKESVPCSISCNIILCFLYQVLLSCIYLPYLTNFSPVGRKPAYFYNFYIVANLFGILVQKTVFVINSKLQDGDNNILTNLLIHIMFESSIIHLLEYVFVERNSTVLDLPIYYLYFRILIQILTILFITLQILIIISKLIRDTNFCYSEEISGKDILDYLVPIGIIGMMLGSLCFRTTYLLDAVFFGNLEFLSVLQYTNTGFVEVDGVNFCLEIEFFKG